MIVNCQAGNILLIAYSFSCDSFDCELWKTRNSQSKESRNQNPTYGIRVLPRKKSRVVLLENIGVVGSLIVAQYSTRKHVLHVVSRCIIYGRGN